MKIKTLPSAAYLHECFVYRNGKLFWKRRPKSHFATARAWGSWVGKYAGKRAGFFCASSGYRHVGISSNHYFEHRVIAAMHGMTTDILIDHKNGITTDNRIENLRPATISQNQANSLGKKGLRGISFHKRIGRWQAYINFHGKRSFLGYFDDYEKALIARIAAEKSIHGEFAYAQRTNTAA